MTGTFDNWTKSVKLEKEGDVFQKTVDLDLSDASGKIYYKVRGYPVSVDLLCCCPTVLRDRTQSGTCRRVPRPDASMRTRTRSIPSLSNRKRPQVQSIQMRLEYDHGVLAVARKQMAGFRLVRGELKGGASLVGHSAHM